MVEVEEKEKKTNAGACVILIVNYAFFPLSAFLSIPHHKVPVVLQYRLALVVCREQHLAGVQLFSGLEEADPIVGLAAKRLVERHLRRERALGHGFLGRPGECRGGACSLTSLSGVFEGEEKTKKRKKKQIGIDG